MLDRMREELTQSIPAELVDRLLECYQDLKHNFYLGHHRSSELEGGRFSEAMVRILESRANLGRSYTPFAKQLPKMDTLLKRFENLDPNVFHDSIRLHIPRALNTIYNVRNRRDVGHVGGDVSPNLSDSTLVMAVCDWVLTELIRLYYTRSIDEAQHIVDSLVERRTPIIQDFNGFLKLLRPNLSIPKRILAFLYVVGDKGATLNDLRTWSRSGAPSAFNMALSRLDASALIHREGDKCLITRAGIVEVEKNIDLEFLPTDHPSRAAKQRRKPNRRRKTNVAA